MEFPVHTIHSAPAAAREALDASTRSYGFLPNLFAVMAEAPAMLDAYRSLGAIFDRSSLTPVERQVVLLATSAENGCEYCVAAHTVIGTMQKVPADVLESLRAGWPIADARLEALRRFTSVVVSTRARLAPGDLESFLAAGFTRAHVLEVIVGVGMKTLSNYTNHLAHTPLDHAFASAAWTQVA